MSETKPESPCRYCDGGKCLLCQLVSTAVNPEPYPSSAMGVIERFAEPRPRRTIRQGES